MFRAGATTYSVRINITSILLDGEECLGTCNGDEKIILLSPRISPDKRLSVLLHELTHAWIFEVGEPGDVEGMCDLCATVATACIRDLVAAGGEEGLRRLRPGERLGPMKSRIGLLRSRFCECGGMIAPGEIHCEKDDNNPEQLQFRMYCTHCDLTTIWNEKMAFGGAPSGELAGMARQVKGNKLPVTI